MRTGNDEEKKQFKCEIKKLNPTLINDYINFLTMRHFQTVLNMKVVTVHGTIGQGSWKMRELNVQGLKKNVLKEIWRLITLNKEG